MHVPDVTPIRTTVNVLCDVVGMLNRPRSPSNPALARRLASDIAGDGWAPRLKVEDVVCELGCAAAVMGGYHELLNVPFRTVYGRPVGSSHAEGEEMCAASDVAAFAMDLERLGFSIDPSPLVEAVLPSLEGKRLLTAGDLRVLWFERHRHRQVPIRLDASDHDLADARNVVGMADLVTLRTGYRMTSRRPGGRLVSVVVSPPLRAK